MLGYLGALDRSPGDRRAAELFLNSVPGSLRLVSHRTLTSAGAAAEWDLVFSLGRAAVLQLFGNPPWLPSEPHGGGWLSLH